MRKNALSVILLFILLFLSNSILWAQSCDVEIDGLIIDQTKSKMGHDFASNFSLFWETMEVGYNIVIYDQSEPRGGGWVLIEINDSLVFKALLKPNAEEIENLSKEAVEACNEFLNDKSESIRNLEQEKDMKGNGIY